jgi:hypothetical protein
MSLQPTGSPHNELVGPSQVNVWPQQSTGFMRGLRLGKPMDVHQLIWCETFGCIFEIRGRAPDPRLANRGNPAAEA